MSDLDLSKPVRTLCSEDSVTVLYARIGGKYEPVGYSRDQNGATFIGDGWVDHLENIPQKRSGWRVGYRGPDGAIYLAAGSTARSREECSNRIQGDGKNMDFPVHVEWEE